MAATPNMSEVLWGAKKRPTNRALQELAILMGVPGASQLGPASFSGYRDLGLEGAGKLFGQAGALENQDEAMMMKDLASRRKAATDEIAAVGRLQGMRSYSDAQRDMVDINAEKARQQNDAAKRRFREELEFKGKKATMDDKRTRDIASQKIQAQKDTYSQKQDAKLLKLSSQQQIRLASQARKNLIAKGIETPTAEQEIQEFNKLHQKISGVGRSPLEGLLPPKETLPDWNSIQEMVDYARMGPTGRGNTKMYNAIQAALARAQQLYPDDKRMQVHHLKKVLARQGFPSRGYAGEEAPTTSPPRANPMNKSVPGIQLGREQERLEAAFPEETNAFREFLATMGLLLERGRDPMF